MSELIFLLLCPFSCFSDGSSLEKRPTANTHDLFFIPGTRPIVWNSATACLGISCRVVFSPYAICHLAVTPHTLELIAIPKKLTCSFLRGGVSPDLPSKTLLSIWRQLPALTISTNPGNLHSDWNDYIYQQITIYDYHLGIRTTLSGITVGPEASFF